MKKSEPNLCLKDYVKNYPKPTIYFTETEKHIVIKEYLMTGKSKQAIWIKYTGMNDHGVLINWMRKFGYLSGEKRNIMSKIIPTKEEENFELHQLKKRIEQLEKQLKDSELKALAFSRMVDIAEEEFKIPIRKKFNSKP